VPPQHIPQQRQVCGARILWGCCGVMDPPYTSLADDLITSFARMFSPAQQHPRQGFASLEWAQLLSTMLGEQRAAREEQRKRDEAAREEQRKRDEEQRAAREEQRKRDEAAREEQLQRLRDVDLTLRQATGHFSATPTPATVGKRAYEALVSAGKWRLVPEVGPPVITEAQSREVEISIVNQSGRPLRESRLICWFTPHLQRLVDKAGAKVGKMLLVNSERHPWVLDPHLGAASKPDLFCVHPAFWKEQKSATDQEHDGPGFCFGVLAEWTCRDCVECVWEWKVQMGNDDFSALGEGIEYCKRLSHLNESTRSTLDVARARGTRLIVCDWKTFFLVRCMDGIPVECSVGSWASCGSEEAVVNFLSAEVSRTWASVLGSVCIQLDVELDGQSFLGCGAVGRVFKVTARNGAPAALKVAFGEDGCSNLRAEFHVYQAFQQRLSGITSVTCGTGHCHDWGDKHQGHPAFAGLLLTPLGGKLPQSKSAMRSALQGLKRLSEEGFKHGDARQPNVIWNAAGGQAVWVDIRMLSEVAVDESARAQAFASDVADLAKSLKIDLSGSMQSLCSELVCAEPGSQAAATGMEQLLDMFAPFWTAGQGTGGR